MGTETPVVVVTPVAPADAAPVPAPVVDSAVVTPPADGQAAGSDPDRAAVLFGKIAEQRAALRRREMSLEARVAKIAELEAIEAKIDEDPSVLLEKRPDLYERLTRRVLEQAAANEPATPEDEIASIKAKLAERERAEADAKAAEDKATGDGHIAAGIASIEQAMAASSDKYELIIARGAYRDVFDGILKYCNDNQIRPTSEQLIVLRDKVAEVVQAQLEKEAEQDMEILRSKAPNFSKRFAAPLETQQTGTNDSPGARPSGSVTLTSRNTSEAPPPRPTSPMSRDESIRSAWDKAKAVTSARRATL